MVKLPVMAVDVGNARIKLGLFSRQTRNEFPDPLATLVLDGRRPEWGRITPWLKESAEPHAAWWIASVNRPATTRLLDWIRDRRPADPITLLSAGDLPLAVELKRPDMVGVDRLLDAGSFRETGSLASKVTYDDEGNIESFTPSNFVTGQGRGGASVGEPPDPPMACEESAASPQASRPFTCGG